MLPELGAVRGLTDRAEGALLCRTQDNPPSASALPVMWCGVCNEQFSGPRTRRFMSTEYSDGRRKKQWWASRKLTLSHPMGLSDPSPGMHCPMVARCLSWQRARRAMSSVTCRPVSYTHLRAHETV